MALDIADGETLHIPEGATGSGDPVNCDGTIQLDGTLELAEVATPLRRRDTFDVGNDRTDAFDIDNTRRDTFDTEGAG